MSETLGSSWTVKYTNTIVRFRWWIVVATLLIAGLLASGMRFLTLDTDYRVFFSKNNPQLRAFEALQNIYTKNDNILFVLAPPNGEVFESETLAAIKFLTQEAWQIPYAIRVDSLTNFQNTTAEGDDLIVADLVESPQAASTEDLDEVQTTALNEPLLFRRLISEDSQVTGVNVTFQLPAKTAAETPKAVEAARELASRFRERYPQIDLHLTGMLMLNHAFSEASIIDIKTLVPFMYLGIFLTMWFLLKSFRATFATLLVILFSVVSAMGIAGLLDIGITPPTAAAPTVIMTLAVADSIHILVSMLTLMRSGYDRKAALIESMRINWTPVFLTSLTTIIGFLSMNFSDAPPFRDLGNVTAIGVLAAFIYSVTFLPAAMAILQVRVAQTAGTRTKFMERLGAFVVRRRKTLFIGGMFVVAVFGAFVPKNHLNDQWIEYFGEAMEFRQDTDFAMDRLTGIYDIQFSLESGETGGISNPDYLRTLDQFAAWFRDQPEVIQVQSFSDTMKRLNQALHGDDPDWYRIPDNRELAAQYLLLYELSLPYGLDLNNQIDVAKSATRFMVVLEDVTSNEIKQIAARGEDWLQQNAPEAMHTRAASSAVMFAHIAWRNITGMLWGSTFALILISMVLMIALRSFKFGLISLIPNLMPAVLGFGIWGLWVGQVNMALSVVTGMTLGIVVDDTVHFLSKYLRARREQGLNAADAVKYAFTSVGMAMIVTSLVLIVGFSILSFSAFQLNAAMGRLTAIVVAAALLVDFILLPPLLMKFSGEMPEKKTAA